MQRKGGQTSHSTAAFTREESSAEFASSLLFFVQSSSRDSSSGPVLLSRESRGARNFDLTAPTEPGRIIQALWQSRAMPETTRRPPLS
jgi:hypothetical protein